MVRGKLRENLAHNGEPISAVNETLANVGALLSGVRTFHYYSFNIDYLLVE